MLRITVRGPRHPPVRYELERAAVKVGRDPANDLAIPDPLLSRFHAEVQRQPAGWVVCDLRSRNGTRLNGNPVLGEAALQPGDEIQLGETVLVFEEAGSATAVARGDVSATLSRRLDLSSLTPALVGRSPALARLRKELERVASSSSTVLLSGESGTGKEVAACLLHALSPRRARPLVIVNCPALPGGLVEAELFGVEKQVATGVAARSGRIEEAEGGTILLDEVGDLELAAQAKLLRFLQDHTVDRVGSRSPRRVDVRVLAATHRDLAAAVERGEFRRDLFFRLNVVTLTLPPLRERREDVPELTRHFVARRGERRPVDEEAMARLVRHDWPGNVRELEHVVERACLLAEGATLAAADFVLSRFGPGGAPAVPGAADADELYTRIVHGGESFWELVRQPFLHRQLAAETVRALIERACREHGSYKEVARAFRIEAEHKRLLDFLRRHRLSVARPPRD